MLVGLKGTFYFVDYIIVAGKDDDEHPERLKVEFRIIEENGLKICKSNESLQYHQWNT